MSDDIARRQILERRSLWLKLLLTRERTIHERTNLFIVAHAFLLSAYVYVTREPALRLTINLVALIISWVWFYIGFRTKRTVRYLWEGIKGVEKMLPEEEQVLTTILNQREKFPTNLRTAVVDLLLFLMPLLWVFCWLVVLVVFVASRPFMTLSGLYQ